MKILRMLALLIALLCILMPQTGTLAAENLVQNSGFEAVSEGMPQGWQQGKWVTDPACSVFQLSTQAHSGQYSAMLTNSEPNDARFEQVISVKPKSYYRISAWVKAQDCDPSLKGANISVSGVYDTSRDVHDTQGEWVELIFYGRTGDKQQEITLMCRVGGYGSLATGTAYFDDVQVEQVDSVPEDAAYMSLWQEPVVQKQEKTSTPGSATLPFLLLFSLLFGVYVLAVRQRYLVNKLPSIPKQGRAPLLLILAIAGVARLLVAYFVRGYEVDINCFHAWSTRMATGGPGNFYSPDIFCDYPPGYLYVLWLCGWINNSLGLPYGSAGAGLVLKLVPILCDLGTAWLMYQATARRIGERRATALGLLWALNPVPMLVGSAWGQVDGVLALGLIATLLLAEEGYWQRAIPVFALSVLMKPQALMLAPIGVIALVQDLMQRKGEPKRVQQALLGIFIALTGIVVLSVPFWGKQGPFWLIDLYAKTLGSYPKATVNAANLFYLLGGNWVEVSTPALFGVPWSFWGWLLMGLWFSLVVYLTLKIGGCKHLWELCALLYVGLFVLGAKMHERYLFPALPLILMAFGRSRDRRWLWAFWGFTATMLINTGMVLAFEHLWAPYEWLGKLLGAINVGLTGLITWTVWDSRVKGHVMECQQHDAKTRSWLVSSRVMRATLETPDARLNMKGLDWALMLGVTALYAVVAFTGLGDTKAPQTHWQASAPGEQVVFDLGETRDVELLYYSYISQDGFTVAFSDDGQVWTDESRARLNTDDSFSWQKYHSASLDAEGAYQFDGRGNLVIERYPQLIHARYVRFTSLGGRIQLGEVGFRDTEDRLVPLAQVAHDGQAPVGASDLGLLVDEQDAVPLAPNYLNSTYFDEIYHARTAYEHLHGLTPYETTHPPLGKLIMSVFIWLFGMTPFGWRFAGTLMGLLMLPTLYLMGKQLFRKARWGFMAMALMALDLMHLTQTRIATIDSFPVLFIALSYLCMFRYVRMSFYHQKLWRTLVPLGLSGFFLGLAIASKWIGLYAALGLAVLLFYALGCRLQEYLCALRENDPDPQAAGHLKHVRRHYLRYTAITLGWCLVFFLVVPGVIYYLSYIPYLSPNGPVTLERLWDAQMGMLSYHSRLQDDHSFQSPWYSWPVIGKPMWFYNGESKPPAMTSVIYTMGNPAVWWVGLVALLICMVLVLVRSWARVSDSASARLDRLKLTGMSNEGLILIGFLSQYLPWVLVPRSTYIYHYFASIPFVILCIVLCARGLWDRLPVKLRWVLYVGYLLITLGLFIAFYPIATGVTVSLDWAEAVRWFPHWLYF